MKYIFIAIISALLADVSSCFAQNSAEIKQDSSYLSLASAIDEGLNNNFAIRLKKIDKERADLNATPGNAGMLPNLNLNGSFNHVLQNPNIINASVGLNLDWIIFDGLQMFIEYDKLKLLQGISEINLRAQILQTTADIIDAYYNIVAQELALNATKRILDISRLRMNAANDLYITGKASKIELLSAKVDFNADTAAYISGIEAVRQAKIDLNNILNREITTNFTVTDSILIAEEILYSQILDKALQDNPELALARANVNISEHDIKIATAKHFPTLKLNSAYSVGVTKPAFRNNYGFSYGASLSMPLFNGLNIQREVKAAQLQKSANIIQAENIQSEISAKLSNAYSKYVVNKKLMTFEAANLDIALESLDIAMERYKFGAISAVELRDIQRNYLAAVNRHIVALYNTKIAETTLNLIAGEINI